jgi:hypothetical protein
MATHTRSSILPEALLTADWRLILSFRHEEAALIPPVTMELLEALPPHLWSKFGDQGPYDGLSVDEKFFLVQEVSQFLFQSKAPALTSTQWGVVIWIARGGIRWTKSAALWSPAGSKFLNQCRERLGLPPGPITLFKFDYLLELKADFIWLHIGRTLPDTLIESHAKYFQSIISHLLTPACFARIDLLPRESEDFVRYPLGKLLEPSLAVRARPTSISLESEFNAPWDDEIESYFWQFLDLPREVDVTTFLEKLEKEQPTRASPHATEGEAEAVDTGHLLNDAEPRDTERVNEVRRAIQLFNNPSSQVSEPEWRAAGLTLAQELLRGAGKRGPAPPSSAPDEPQGQTESTISGPDTPDRVPTDDPTELSTLRSMLTEVHTERAETMQRAQWLLDRLCGRRVGDEQQAELAETLGTLHELLTERHLYVSYQDHPAKLAVVNEHLEIHDAAGHVVVTLPEFPPLRVEQVRNDSDWSSTLSMEEASQLLEKHKASLPPEVFPAVSTFMLHLASDSKAPSATTPIAGLHEIAHLETNAIQRNSQRSPQPAVDQETPQETDAVSGVSELCQQLKTFEASDTKTLQANEKNINRMLSALANKKFPTANELQDTVHSIQEIVRRGKFQLIAAASIKVKDNGKLKLKIKKGAVVTLTAESPHGRYKTGRIGVTTGGDWTKSVRRVALFHLSVTLKKSAG